MSTQASPPASAPVRARHPGGATGTASTTRAAPCARTIWQAARAMDPVAMSTRAENIAWMTSGRIPDSSPGGPALCSGMGEGYGAQI
ncbi:MAG: hypothetical protein ACLPKE_22465 [Streptosporangiaceae bacterium]